MSNELVLAGERLCARFFMAGDRYAHAIALRNQGRDGTLLESIEGTPDDVWPPSPVLQSCHLENLPNDRRVALLVGMAGRSHWSMAAELMTESGSERLVFDIACRASASPGRLGNRYRLGPATCWDGATRVLQSPLGMAQLGASGDESEVEVRPGSSTQEIEIVPPRWDQALPATIRWKFAITV